jgi:hypothetical protein
VARRFSTGTWSLSNSFRLRCLPADDDVPNPAVIASGVMIAAAIVALFPGGEIKANELWSRVGPQFAARETPHSSGTINAKIVATKQQRFVATRHPT